MQQLKIQSLSGFLKRWPERLDSTVSAAAWTVGRDVLRQIYNKQ